MTPLATFAAGILWLAIAVAVCRFFHCAARTTPAHPREPEHDASERVREGEGLVHGPSNASKSENNRG